ncbi:MAG: NAD(P)-dependent oxidoreductase [Sphingobacteriia bacterium]|nr:MAG: NAD(P)-dependent oxidoreductase [Sphingobacteriia bacterium]
MYKILVTGASGFVGKYLCNALKKIGHEVVAITSQHGDISQITTWENLPPTNVVIHLAARTFVPDSWKKPDLFLETNTLGTLRALEYCKKHHASIVYISSYLYGNAKILPIQEDAPVFTPNPYALSKKTAEEYCKLYADSYGVNTVILRPFNIYGNNQNPSFLIPEIIHQVLHGKAVHVKDLAPKRDYLFIDDFIQSIIKAIHLNQFEIINIGSGISYSVKELIDMVQFINGSHYPVTSSNEIRTAEIMNTIADISKAAKVLNWKPLVSMEEGLFKIIEQVKLNRATAE